MWTPFLEFATALRSLRRTPVLAGAAVLSLAVGIGANAAVFSLVHAVVLRPLPVRDSDRLVGLFTTDRRNVIPVIGPQLPMSWPNLQDVSRDTAALSGVAAYTFPFAVALTRGAGGSEQAAVELVTGNYFDLLGVHAAAGRTLQPGEDLIDGAAPVVVISDRAFRRRFGSDKSILGGDVRLNGIAFTVVGVGPRGFDGVNNFVAPDFWIPIGMRRGLLPSEYADWFASRRALFLNGIGRLADSASSASLDGQLARLGESLAAQYPRDNDGRGLASAPLRETAILPGLRNLLVMGSSLLLGLVGLVLLVACANVANILLARATERRGELALRLALGADRRRLLRLLLIDSLIVAMAGGVAGLLVGQLGIKWLWTLRPPGLLGQNFVDIALDPPVLIYAGAATALTTLLFGLAPALSASRANPSALLAEDGRARGAGPAVMRRAHLVVGAQVAAALVILGGAAMLIASLRAAQHIDPGFAIDHLAVLQVSPEQASLDSARTRALYRDLRERLATLPGIAAASWSQLIPLYGNGVSRTVQAWEAGDDPARGIAATSNVVDQGFFATLAIPLVAGREFGADDREGTRAVVVVNDILAARLWPNRTAVGQQLRLFGEEHPHEVVGIARASRYTSLGETPQPAVFRPLAQAPVATMALVVRGSSDPEAALSLATDALRDIEPSVPTPFTGTMRTVAQRSLWATQLGASVLSVLGGISLILAALGVFGVAHYSSTQRQFEIAVRLAVGASPAAAGRLVVGRTMKAVAAGVVTGGLLAVSLVLGSRSLLYDAGWWPFAGLAIGGALLVITALAASVWPAAQAAYGNPSALLK